MIRHIVLWRVKEAGGFTAAENAVRMKDALERMEGKIPGMTRLFAGVDISRVEQSSDVALYAEFEDRGSLEAYSTHPVHEEFKAFIDGFRTERRVVDF